jgi:GNAT superfamily N-acetyltransferase
VTVILRPATQDDASTIATVHITARRDTLPYLPDLHSDEETVGWIANIVLPNQDVWIAQIDDVVVGYTATIGDELNDLYVLPLAQGLGIGTALLSKAKELSPGRLSLWTFQRNARARSFYERRGFVAMEFTNGAGNEEREPDVRYEWTSTGSEIGNEDVDGSKTQANGRN